MAKILTVSRKKTKLLTVNRKSHHPIETLMNAMLRKFSPLCSSSEVNSDVPIYILTEQISEKIKCPERDWNPRHPDLMKGALTTELPRQPRWSESNTCYKGNIDY